MSAAPIRFEAGDGSAVVELDPAALASLAAGESAASPWSLSEGPDWDRFESLRLLAASFADGSMAAVIAMRPAGSEGHDAENMSGVLAEAGKDASDAHEVMLSTEFDSEGLVRRVGLELWTSEEPPPRRLAADRAQVSSTGADGIERQAVLMDARLDGETGTALFEVVKPAT